jgi:hypothetical protein
VARLSTWRVAEEGRRGSSFSLGGNTAAVPTSVAAAVCRADKSKIAVRREGMNMTFWSSAAGLGCNPVRGDLLVPLHNFVELINGATMMPPMDLDLNSFERHEILFRRPLLAKIYAAAIPPAA